MAIWVEMIATVGFPIASAIAMAAFVFHIYKQNTKENVENMEGVQGALYSLSSYRRSCGMDTLKITLQQPRKKDTSTHFGS